MLLQFVAAVYFNDDVIFEIVTSCCLKALVLHGTWNRVVYHTCRGYLFYVLFSSAFSVRASRCGR